LPIKQIIVQIDTQSLDFEQLHIASGALASLESLAKLGAIKMETSNIRKPNKLRSDALPPDKKRLQPQTQAILACMENESEREYSADDIAETLSIPGNSVRAQLHLLQARGYVRQSLAPKNGTTGRRRTLWRLLPEA
jgi:response regulator of citrate/malate metabolism